MRSTIIVIGFVVSSSLLFSCKKGGVSPSFVYVPWEMDSLMPSALQYVVSPANLTVNGVMMACKVSGDLTDTSGNVNSYRRVWEAALFSSGASDTSNAGVSSVSVNSVGLSKANTYRLLTHYDSLPLWNENTLNHWNVAGSDKIPAFSADIDGAFPEFTGTLPVAISKSTDFTFSFNSSNVVNGDSAYVILYLYSFAVPAYSNVVSARGGVITFSNQLLRDRENGNFALLYFQTNPVIYNGGLIMLVIYNHTIQTFGGKQFAFVKQREIMGIVKFL